MDQIISFVEPAKKFTKDSIRLVKRCTKPDRKGKQSKRILICLSLSKIIAHDLLFEIEYRISKDRGSYCYWFRYNGLHRILCEIDSHSNQ